MPISVVEDYYLLYRAAIIIAIGPGQKNLSGNINRHAHTYHIRMYMDFIETAHEIPAVYTAYITCMYVCANVRYHNNKYSIIHSL